MARAKASYDLMYQAQDENVPVYRWNRGGGAQRQVVTMTGPPDSPEAQEIIASRYQGEVGPSGLEPDVTDEDALRAMLAALISNATWEAASENFINGAVALLNHGVYPVIASRGARGEADFIPAGATMGGRGFAYYQGQRIPAADALRAAGLQPFQLSGNDNAMNTVSSLTAGKAALLVHDAREYLEWSDLAYAMTLNGMNSSLTPLAMPTQGTRPFPWANYGAARVMEMLRGSYLFDMDTARILQDPEGLRALVWRQGAVWEAWANLRDNALIQMNSSDHNPTARPGVTPQDAWELSTPWFMQYYIQGGRFSEQGGFIFSNSNWDPFPLTVSIEQFGVAVMNRDSIIVETIRRFSDPFFTVVTGQEVLGPGAGFGGGGGGALHWLWPEIISLAMPLSPPGIGIAANPADIGAVPLLRLERANRLLNVSRELMAAQVLTAAYWMDVRQTQDANRNFGPGPTAAHAALRQIVPLRPVEGAPPAARSAPDLVADFIRDTPASRFWTDNVVMPRPERIPIAAPTRQAAGRP